MYRAYRANLRRTTKKNAGFYQPDSNKKKGLETTGRSRNEKEGGEMIGGSLSQKERIEHI